MSLTLDRSSYFRQFGLKLLGSPGAIVAWRWRRWQLQFSFGRFWMLRRHLSHKKARDQRGSSDQPPSLLHGTSGSAVHHVPGDWKGLDRENPTPSAVCWGKEYATNQRLQSLLGIVVCTAYRLTACRNTQYPTVDSPLGPREGQLPLCESFPLLTEPNAY